MKIALRILGILLCVLTIALFVRFGRKVSSVSVPTKKLQVPETGMYEGVYPDFPETPDLQWKEKIESYQQLIGKKVAWVTLMNDFVDGPLFPKQAVKEIAGAGTTPFIRVLPRSERVQGVGPELKYRLDLIGKGKFDDVLRQWCKDARASETPLLVEFLQEPNGNWYGWGGDWNGAGEHKLSPNVPDGPFRYQLAYRHFVDLCRSEGAGNITWFFHVDAQPKPRKDWNTMANYYPGDDYIDWIGLSVYGAQYPSDYWSEFNEVLEPAYRELCNVTLRKPMAVLETGVIEDPKDPKHKANWLGDALTALSTNQYPRIKGVNYWHESSWTPEKDNNFRVDSSPAALAMFRSLIQEPVFVSKTVFNK